jgi:hypothetical protein
MAKIIGPYPTFQAINLITTTSIAKIVDITIFMVHPTGFEPATDGFHFYKNIKFLFVLKPTAFNALWT